jgi:citrate lyase subunit beta/citryl-CoA lyase
MMRAWRSLLFVPGHQESRLSKAHTRGADAVIIDLEDAVPAEQKSAAREMAAAAAARLAAESQDVVIRINATWRVAAADLEAVVRPGVAALMVPKVEDANRLRVISEMIVEWEAERGIASGTVGLLALVESPIALPRLHEIASVDRVIGLALGPEDFCAVLGVSPSPASLDLPCKMLALAAAARGLNALGSPISIADFRALDRWQAAADRARSFGMTGAMCIHPDQVAPLNLAFGVSAEELADAERIIQAWERSAGSGVAELDGKMIDLPVVLRARRTLANSRPLPSQLGPPRN